MAKANTEVGDVFVKLDANTKKYFQLIAIDLTQLNSDVIRVFKTSYELKCNPDLSQIVNDEVEFYAHCITKFGIKLDFWEKIGNSAYIGDTDILFRSSGDDRKTKISEKWWMWKINKEQKYVGKLTGEYQKAEIGSVIPPDSIVYRMLTGKYDFRYPKY